MSHSRWQHLDLRKPEAPEPSSGTTPGATPREVSDPSGGIPEAPGSSPLHPALRAAGARYTLKQFEACADLLSEALAADGEIPGARRLLGLSLGRCDDPAGAARALAAAVTEAPHDSDLRASLLSAQIQAGLLPDYPVPDPTGALAELAGAAAWIRGQARLREGHPRDAARLFGESAEWFTRGTPSELLSDRLAAAFVAQSISYLVAGQLETAQGCLSRLTARSVLPESALGFARELYAVADEARALSPEERAEVLAELAELVTRVRLRIRFYDALRPVAMHWENLG